MFSKNSTILLESVPLQSPQSLCSLNETSKRVAPFFEFHLLIRDDSLLAPSLPHLVLSLTDQQHSGDNPSDNFSTQTANLFIVRIFVTTKAQNSTTSMTVFIYLFFIFKKFAKSFKRKFSCTLFEKWSKGFLWNVKLLGQSRLVIRIN